MPAASGKPAEPWGRVDEHGAVFVRTPDGPGPEVKVGEWLAGEPAEGLRFYERKYATLSVEIGCSNIASVSPASRRTKPWPRSARFGSKWMSRTALVTSRHFDAGSTPSSTA